MPAALNPDIPFSTVATLVGLIEYFSQVIVSYLLIGSSFHEEVTLSVKYVFSGPKTSNQAAGVGGKNEQE
jgi:hypothetical protein